MRVVIDANVVAAALIRPNGWTATELGRPDVTFYAPRQLLAELGIHVQTLATKACVPRAEWQRRVGSLQKVVRWVSTSRIARTPLDSDQEAMDAVDPDDTIYVACAKTVHADFLWTRDKGILRTLPRLARAVLPPP